MAEDTGLFRKKSLESISSPEQMNDYIKVIGPGLWIVLGAVIVFLVGVIIWGIFGRLETGVNSVGFVNDGLAVCYVEENTVEDINDDTEINLGGEYTRAISVSKVPVQASVVYDTATLEKLGLSGYEMLYPVTIKSALPDGSYHCRIVTEEIHPMSFITGDQK